MLKFFNKPLRILLVTNALVLVAGAMLGPIYALFVEEIGGDLLDASYTFFAFSFTAGITTLFSGKFCDKNKNPKFILALGYFIMSLGFFAYLFVNSIWFLFLAQMVIGLGEAVYSPAFDVAYSHHLTKKKEGREWGAWESLYYFITSIGAVVGGLLISKFGFNIAFILMGLLCLGSACYVLLLPKRTL